MFLLHHLEEEYNLYASLHSKEVLEVNTSLLIVTIWVGWVFLGFFFGVQICCLKASYGSSWRLQRYCLRKPNQLEWQLSFWTFHASFVFRDVVKVKIKDKFMTRERIVKWCLSFIALFPRLKQGHYTLCRRRCIQSLPLEKLGINRSRGIHSSPTLSL